MIEFGTAQTKYTTSSEIPRALILLNTYLLPCANTRIVSWARGVDGLHPANVAAIPNYADRRRHGEPIASGFTESAVNQVVSKRMVKKQQMRWTQRGAHTLLQVRARVLNRQLRQDFERWYPQLKQSEVPQRLTA